LPPPRAAEEADVVEVGEEERGGAPGRGLAGAAEGPRGDDDVLGGEVAGRGAGLMDRPDERPEMDRERPLPRERCARRRSGGEELAGQVRIERDPAGDQLRDERRGPDEAAPPALEEAEDAGR